MNRLIHNYTARVVRVATGREFDCIVSLGFNHYFRTTLRINHMKDLPDRKSKDPRLKTMAVRALACLSEILMETPATEEDPGVGRKIIAATTQPDKFGQSHALVYIPARRAVRGITDEFASKRLLNVFKLMMLLQSQPEPYPVEMAREKIREAQISGVGDTQ